MKSTTTLALVLILSATAVSATIHVPGDYPLIQDAIDAAASGDVILVGMGTYIENLHFSGKTLTLKSVNGPEWTVIDGSKVDTVVNLMNSLGGSVVDGFTIKNGYGEEGGGIRANTHVHIHDCMITNNETQGPSSPGADGDGGGISCASALITDCIIESNLADIGSYWGNGRGGHGGGIYAHSGTVVIQNCKIRNNNAGDGLGDTGGTAYPGGSGGGVYAKPGVTVEIAHCEIFNNRAGTGADDFFIECGSGGHGGGVYCLKGSIRSCRFAANEAGDGGAPLGFGAYGGKGGCGGGVYGSAVTIENCLLTGNEAGISQSGISSPPGEPGHGGGVFFETSGAGAVINCTLYGNDARFGVGGGIHGSTMTVTNSILWQNEPDEMIQSSQQVTFSTVFKGWPGKAITDEDPLFVDPASSDYHLQWTSPCINRGTFDGAPAVDIDGDPRPFMGAVDMGADEFTGHHSLESDTFTLSVSQGGEVNFHIDAGPDHAGQPYILLGATSGTAPGFRLPGGMRLKLNLDGFTDIVVDYLNTPYFMNFMSKLDATGQATATLWVPGLAPSWIGHTMYYSGTLFSPFDFVTNPILIVPGE